MENSNIGNADNIDNTETTDPNSTDVNLIANKLKDFQINTAHELTSSLYKSTDFNAREFEERLESPTNIESIAFHPVNLHPNNNLIHNNQTCSTNSGTPTSFTKELHLPYTTEYSNLKNTLHLKIIFITNLHYSLQNYVNDVYNLFNKIDAIIYKKATFILDKSKYFQRFFKEITTLYETFSINLLQANNTINLHFKEEDDSCPFSQINSTIDKSQELISNSFYDFSKNLQSKIISKGPLSNVKEYYNKMSNISKESQLILSEITKKRDKLVLKFSNFEKIFENFKKSFHDQEKLSSILLKNEFFLIEFEYCNSVNKLFKKIEVFFLRHKKCLTDLKELIENFISSLKETVDIYVLESKKMFLIEDMDNILDKIKIQVNSLNESASDILMNSSNNKILNLNLKNLQTNLLTFVKKEQIYDNELFKIDKYNNFEELIDFLISVLPENCSVVNSSLVIFVCEVKKVSGLFKSYKNCVMLVTIQNSVLIFEEKVNKKTHEKFSLKNLKFRNSEDKKHPYRFEMTEIKLGMIYNSTVKMTLEVENEELYRMIENVLTR